jgi:succinyl-CoA synthetase alpha subunit
LVSKNTRLIVQGITGREGSFHTKTMVAYGTQIVAGVAPGRGGVIFEGIRIYDTVEQAKQEMNANASVIFVPQPFASDAILEAMDAQVDLIVCITEGIPLKDVIAIHEMKRGHPTFLVGPNTPGVITPGEAKVGGVPNSIYRPGRIGVISRSGALSYEVANILSEAGLGQSTCVGIGGDLIPFSSFKDVLALFNSDPGTDMVVMIGEIGGIGEIEAARFIEENMSKPVMAIIGGQYAPPGKKMGHAGAIISGKESTAQAKIQALESAGVSVVDNPWALVNEIKKII